MPIASINPADGKLLKRFKPSTRREVETALSSAMRAFERWKAVPIPERGRHLMATAQRLRERRDQYAHLITVEMGKPIGQSAAEIEKCAWVCEYFADNAAVL